LTAAATGDATAGDPRYTALKVEARGLAEEQRHLRRAGAGIASFLDLTPSLTARALERARNYFSSKHFEDATLQKAADWFLDNFYLIRRVARQTSHDLPRGFLRRLPELANGAANGVPRVNALARALAARSSIEIDVTALQGFVEAYQEVSPLTIAEIWALPTMLRVSVLHGLLQFLDELGVPVHTRLERAPSGRTPPDVEPLGLGPGPGVARSIRALRLLAEIDWKVFFEKTSRVEAVLRRDPSRIYERMDFETCDSYRKSVEELAWVTGAAEEEVAELAVELAGANVLDPRCRHVGYYLVDGGRRALEERLGYRPPRVTRIRRALTCRPTLTYLSALAFLTGAPVLVLGWGLARIGTRSGSLAGSALALVPASIVAVTVLQWALARMLPPRRLPQLDFTKGLPDDLRTLVVVPTLLGRREDVDWMLGQIEIHYLGNHDPAARFALLTDDVDSETMPEDELLLDGAAAGIVALNAKYGKDKPGPFHLLHRASRWNPAERRFMGWERKRGKLHELNRLLRGAKDTSFTRHVGDPQGLLGIRYVITVDSDTQLPMGTARRLVGLLAHPLNHATFDDTTGRVASGYTIVQPRIEMSPSSPRQTIFARIFAGDIGFDIYTHAVSESYQDLFGAGVYVGKGIYDVDAFMRSVEGLAPENALASHDLFEGIHGRTALATDIVLFEQYPSHYAAYARRMHRWVRGDWQLFPWLFSRVPSAGGRRAQNRLAAIDRWKIFDNLRRSLASPLLFVLLVSGLSWLPGAPLYWTLATLAVVLVPSFPALLRDRRRRSLNLARCALAIAFLAHEAVVVVDAVLRVIVRMTITRKHLLQWTSAADTAFRLRARSPRGLLWREMVGSPVLAVATAALVALTRPSALLVAGPLLILWFLAPELARWVSQPSKSREEELRPEDRRKLRLLARRTWRFFDAFVGPNEQWLPIDNYQEEPREQTAHRTSPTNIGMMLLSTLAAYDLGYLGPSELSLRVRSAFESIKRLVHYQGHLLNWYETTNLQPLLPRYVSTVDSGNFAGCLVALEQGCRQVTGAPLLRAAAWEGLADSLDLLEEAVRPVAVAMSALRSVISRMRVGIGRGYGDPHEAYATLRVLTDDTSAELDREMLALLETGALRHDAAALVAFRTSTVRFHHQLHQMRHEIDLLLPWLALKDEPVVGALELPVKLHLDQVPAASRGLLAQVDRWERARRERGELSADLQRSADRVREALVRSETHARTLIDELLDLAARAKEEVRGMDFRLLYDGERKLLRIGYNATQDQVDNNHYDLLASEARMASYLAIVKGDVPASHWATLGRPMTQVSGSPALLSWGGTMFEYLMPSLLMCSREGTLLARTCELVVEAHIAYGKKTGAPWGISESAYARLDAHQTYQYQSFGVPGLGFRRGLEEDLVIAPYASVLAVSVRPRAVVDNLRRLEAMGMLGTYGLFEAVDMHPDRAQPGGRPFTVVRSYMAHHQGMLLVALDNLLNEQVMVKRFHADMECQTGELLLNERALATAPREWPMAKVSESADAVTGESPSAAPSPWLSEAQGRPQAFVLGNGRLSSIVTDSGGGGLRFEGLAMTRFQPDVVGTGGGTSIYLRDEETGSLWLAASERSRTAFAAHKAEFHQRDQGLSVHVDVAIAPADDVEVRHITLHNETARTRYLAVTSAAEPVLLPSGQTETHPAFTRMFIESEFVPDLDALFFARRPRAKTDDGAVLVHRLVREGAAVTFAGYETDRAVFFGRHANTGAPASLAAAGRPLRGSVGTVLDPVMSLMARVELKPKRTVTLAFVTSVGRTPKTALELARQYGSMHAVRWALRDAEQESGRRLARARLRPEVLPAVQQLFSALLFADPTLRAPADAVGDARPCKRRLWGRGISGDDPILLVRVHDTQAPILAETIAAQRYLRSCGVRLDLVLVDEQATAYAAEGEGALRTVLAQSDVDEWIDRHGGIFVLAADQLPGDERRHLEASARVVLDTRDGSLRSRMGRRAGNPPNLPFFEPTLQDEGVPRAPRTPPLLFDHGVGGFTEDGNEYAIRVRPGAPTPAPWCNILSNPSFGCLVSESSLGSTWSLNAGENRLTPWSNDPVFDTPAEALYLRDEETAAVWSPTPLPAGGDAETLVRHGAGCTTYERESHGLVQELTIFVPPDAPLKVARLRVKNTLGRPRRLTATYYAEWVLGGLREDQRPYIASEFDAEHGCLLATCNWNTDFGERVAFLASASQVHGFTADRVEFLGRRGDHARPEALERWGLSGTIRAGADPCAALQVHIELGPGEERETHFILGQASDRAAAIEYVARFRKPAVVESAWRELIAFWDGLLGSVRVKTPEPSMDLLLNRWLLYQTISSRFFGRTGFYQSSGAFGYRDQLQDVLALLHGSPERVRGHILEAARHQFEDGDVLHWWHPPVGRGVRTRCSDDMAWLPFATGEYVIATGDTSILSERLPFLTGEALRRDEHDRYAEFAPSTHSESLFEHCRRALERAATEGVHGLPLMGDGDWNDGMSRVGSEGRGESVWLGWFLCATMNRFAMLCDRQNENVGAASWRSRATALRAKIDACAWDGAWYLRAFHDDGSRLGSAKERECQIDSIAQSWAVLSATPGTLDEGTALDRAHGALQAVDARLVREADRLVLLLSPPFDRTEHDPGYIRAYPPGVRENGGQYTHAATWLGWAYAALRDGQRAERIFRILNPILRVRTDDEANRYRVEPYVLAGDVYGAPPSVGRGGWTWYTGAAAWAWRLGVEGILGLSKEEGDLRIEPCIPPTWSGFEAWVRVGAQRVHIVVDNPDAVGGGIAAITLDGVPLGSNWIRLDPSMTGEREVRVRLGKGGLAARDRPGRDVTVERVGSPKPIPWRSGPLGSPGPAPVTSRSAKDPTHLDRLFPRDVIKASR
jgi:cyclic beta-1,2-glucan synthetase